ncbi:MAG: glutamate formiminotransferase, partial [Thermoplasmata archaeon]|nr:glutamate formiminotransferase [Thermoplasmata archaeon]
MKLFESVPNFSEGRDTAVLQALETAARSVPGVALLDVEANHDHNRSVFSLAGEGGPLCDALLRMIEVAVQKIDLNHHTGEHPRMGAVDVVPIVPLGDATTEEATALAVQLAENVWAHLGLPVYLYADSARRPDHADLSRLRMGGF